MPHGIAPLRREITAKTRAERALLDAPWLSLAQLDRGRACRARSMRSSSAWAA
jgi:hypothetical protein